MPFVLRMAHKRQVRMKNESEGAVHIVIPSEVEGSRRESLKVSPRDPSASLGMTSYKVRQKS